MAHHEPTNLGEYVLLEKLGQGGMAQVYRGERTGQAGFRKKVALKRMLPQYRRNPALLERFAAEARTNARLDHPNLVAVVDFGIEPEPYLVMEFVEGVTLASLLDRLLQRGESLETAAALFIGAEAASGLDHAHRKRDEAGNPLGIVHRDVSPQNVLLSNEGAVKVSDFGLVKAADNVVQTGSGIPIGKMSYMAPEQASHMEVDARADVFSLGVVVWEMLAMRVLMPPSDPMKAGQMLVECNFPPPSHYRPDIPPAVDAAVMACLTKDPTIRTPSAQAVGMSLREQLHEIAPGYGRDQLARLLGWAFPERGWSIDEPHATAAQPSAAERLSIPQVSAAPAMERTSHAPEIPDHAKTHVDVQKANPLLTGPQVPVVSAAAARTSVAPQPPTPPAKRSSALPWILLFVGLGGIGLFVLLALALAFFVSFEGTAEEARAAEPMTPGASTPATPNAPAPVATMLLVADVDGALVYRGPTLLGALPFEIDRANLRAGPHVVVARGHHPAVIDPGQLERRMERGRNRTLVPLVPARHPDRAVLVRYPRTATARAMGSRRSLGPVPGLVLLPSTRMGGVPNIEIVELDGTVAMRMSASHCAVNTVCVVEGGVF